ncbi:MAG: ribosome silencing factor [Planctomycetes bacterium]|nr:ribosome silencing factor [Planctomycetota bacterium]
MQLARDLAQVMVDMKAGDVVILDLREVSDFVDAFVLGTATGGARHVGALSSAVWDEYRRRSSYAGHREGTNASGWFLLDCGDVIVHIMSPELREYYALEDLWGDAARIEMGEEERQ